MAIYLDEPLDDEPLFGVVARYLESEPTKLLIPTIRRLFGRWIRASYAAGGLDCVARETKGCWCLSPTEIAESMTDFPYFSSMLTPDRTKQILERTCGLSPNGVTKARPITTWTKPWHGHRFCPVCLREDKLSDGYPHWRRSHQLPGVVVCHLHGEMLWELDRYVDNGTMGYISPSTAIRLGASRINIRLTGLQKKNCRVVAQVSSELIKGDLSINALMFPSEFWDFMGEASRYLVGLRYGACIERLIVNCFGSDYTNKHTIIPEWRNFFINLNKMGNPIRKVIALSLMRIVRETPRLVANRCFMDIYNYSKPEEIRVKMPRKKVPHLTCPSKMARHGAGHAVKTARWDLDRVRAVCDCGMHFWCRDTGAGFTPVRITRWGPDYRREVLRLHELGMRCRVIAHQINVPERTVKHFLYISR
ncbi:hypothetical protein G3N99_03145 [Burkholderia sp. Ac-20392]|nr:hypothetical protein [Burkholderia sp. Se-20378]MBN3793996.1 hypothetical protein [Burkholderia sp. Ac-20392]